MKPYVVAEHEHDPAEEGEIVAEQGREDVPNRLVRSAHTTGLLRISSAV